MASNKTDKPLHFANRAAWRTWLRAHHRRNGGVWVLLYKKQVGRGMTYEAAVQEALCFGWIDGQLRRIDDRCHMLRFSARRKGSVWAPSNIARVKQLIREKKMTTAGLAVFRSARRQKQRIVPTAASQPRIILPTDLRKMFVANRRAWMHFQNYPKSFRRTAIFWVTGAKQKKTRKRRIRAVVANAARYVSPHY